MNERDRFVLAFQSELTEHPDVAPGPTALNRRMGLGSTRNVNGRLSGLRRELLVRAGFREERGRRGYKRWVKS